MATTRLLKNRLVKRTATNSYRFTLPPATLGQLTGLLEEVANELPPELLEELADVVGATSRCLAQALLVRRPFLLAQLDKPTCFVLPPHEAYGLLTILWCDPSINYRGGVLALFQELYQLLLG